MGEPIKMRVREGCRGGREQFKWDSIKEQEFKDREQYLGVSTKVGLMGKFGRYQVNDWYARKRDTAESIDEERGAVQKYEDELMQEALGLKPKKLLLAKRQLSEEELKGFLTKDRDKAPDKQGRELMGPQKKTMTDSQGNEVEAEEMLADGPTKGLGFAAHRNAKLEKYKATVMGTESELQGSGDVKFEIKAEMKAEMKVEVKDEPMDGAAAASSSTGAGLKEELKVEKVEMKEENEDVDSDDKRQRKVEKKLSKKQKKAEKKMKKKVKKAAKKEKKVAKLAAKVAASRRQRASSRSPSQPRAAKRPAAGSGSASSSSSSS